MAWGSHLCSQTEADVVGPYLGRAIGPRAGISRGEKGCPSVWKASVTISGTRRFFLYGEYVGFYVTNKNHPL